MSALLFDEPPLVVQRSAIRALGEHAMAMFVQQVHYRCQSTGIEHAGYHWAVLSNDQWCDACVLTAKQLKRIVASLTQLGVIVRAQNGHYDRTAWTRIDYEQLERLVADSPDALVPRGTDEQSPEGPMSSVPRGPDDLPVKVEQGVRKGSRATIDNGFDAFWRAYPRKVGKPKAQSAWKSVSKDAVAVMIGLARWTVYWIARNEPEFIPHPTTWLNQRRWEDDPPPVTKRSKGAMQDTADRIKVPLAESDSTLAKGMRKALGEVKGIGR